MQMMATIWIVWAALAAAFLALLAYRGTITRYEEDQLFLNESANTAEHQRQDDIVRRCNRLQPIVRVFGGAAGLLTMGIVGMYVWDAWQHFR